MRVFIVTEGPFPYGTASNKRRLCMAKALLKEGIDCKIIVFNREDNRPQIEKNNGFFEGVPVVFIGKDKGGRNKVTKRLIDNMSQYQLVYYLKRHLRSGDAVYTYVNDKYVNALMNRIIRIVHSKHAKYFRELCELPFGTGDETKYATTNRKEVLEKQFPRYDGVITISKNLTELARQYVSKECQVLQLPILVEYEKYAFEDKSNSADVPFIFHSGTLTEQKDGILGMIEAFGLAVQKMQKPIRFVCTGTVKNSKHEKEIVDLITKYKLEDRVQFKGLLSEEELKDYLSKASIVIINKYHTQQNKYCFSTKLGEYMAAGKAIIITNVGEAMNWLSDREDALIVEPHDTNALACAIIELFNDNVLRKTIGENAKITCRRVFDYNVYAKELGNFFLGM